MIYRFDQITVDFPEPTGPNPNAAAAVQELLDRGVQAGLLTGPARADFTGHPTPQAGRAAV